MESSVEIEIESSNSKLVMYFPTLDKARLLPQNAAITNDKTETEMENSNSRLMDFPPL